MTGFLCSVYAVDSRTAKKDRQWVCPLPPRDRTHRLQRTESLFRLHSVSVSKNFGSKRIDLRPNSPSTANLIGPTYRSSSEGWPIHRCGLLAHWHSHSKRQFRIYCKATRTSSSHPWVSKAESVAPIRPPTSQNLPSAAGVRSCADGFLSGQVDDRSGDTSRRSAPHRHGSPKPKASMRADALANRPAMVARGPTAMIRPPPKSGLSDHGARRKKP